MKNTDRLYAALIAAIVAMLLAGVVLAWIFFDNLLDDGGRPGQGIEETAAFLPGATDVNGADEAAIRLEALPASPRKPIRGGASGRERKFQPKIPAQSPTEGTPIQLKSPDRDEQGDAQEAFSEVPVLFEEDCDDYGGAFDFSAQGAGFEILLNPGSVCLNLRRPDVHVEEGTNLIYSVGDGTRDGCELKSELSVCMEMMGAQSGSGGWQGSSTTTSGTTGRENEDGERPPSIYHTENFRRWHRTLPGREQKSPDSRGEGGDPMNTLGNPVNRIHHFTSDPRQHLPDLSAYASVEYPEIYPGIDLTCYADQNRMEFVYVIWPGADPNDIRFAVTGTEGLGIDDSGNLDMRLECGRLLQHAPIAYQVIDDRPVPIDTSYLLDADVVGFEFEDFDRRRPLVLRPTLDYMSFLGGTGFDRAYDITIDNNGYAYVVGASSSPLFGRTDDAPERQRTNVDIFVTKFRVADSQPVYTAFIGGGSTDRAFSIAADGAGNAYICGETLSQDFPITNAPATAPMNDSWNGFITVLGPRGTNLVYSTVIGGSDDDRFYAVALDPGTNIYLAGESSSDDMPVARGFQQRHRGNAWDGYLARINHKTGAIDYATYFGGGGNDTINALAVDSRSNVYIAGETSSADLGLVNPLHPVFGGGNWDGFVARIPAGGVGLTFSSYIGGGNDDRVNGISIDGASNIYLAGDTASSDFPVSSNAVQTAYAGGDWDAFIIKMLPDGREVVYASYLGGQGEDRGFSVDADPTGNAFIAGATTSDDLPIYDAIQATRGGDWDGFVTRFTPSGDRITFSSFMGGSQADELYALTVDGARSAHYAGTTSSTNLPTKKAQQGDYAGGHTEAFVGRLLPEDRRGPDLRLVPSGGQPGGPAYDFYMSEGETTNEELARFLNDAQANPDNARGTHMYFDRLGSVWFNPAMDREAHEVFSIMGSRLVYDPYQSVGERYAVTPKVPMGGGSYSNHPSANVSWYGAVKYCNWLTIDTGRKAEDRCYFEGTNSWDWRPRSCNATNWAKGIFSNKDRGNWLKYKGFRLAMDGSDKPPEMEQTDFAVPNRDFARFLNDAQRYGDTARGTNMFFDAAGSVWFNADMRPDLQMLFDLYDSRLVYNPAKPPGERYGVTTMLSPGGVLYDDFPVQGVTVQGQAKYCNWLTLDAGGTEADRCYGEGATDTAWAPATVDPLDWEHGTFSVQQQEDWLSLTGIKLPLNTVSNLEDWALVEMETYVATSSWPNAFNEFYKASAWDGQTNNTYGFGRRRVTAADGNYLNSGGPSIHDTTPVGYYSGNYDANRLQLTTRNENHFGIHDLAGNVTEWLTDPGKQGSLASRACYGGSWMFTMPKASDRFYVHPHFTDRFRGFRVTSMQSNAKMFMIRLPYHICLCGKGVGPGCGEGLAGADEEAAEENVLRTNMGTADIDGVTYKEPEPEVPVPPGGGAGGDGGGAGGDGGGGPGPVIPDTSPSDL